MKLIIILCVILSQLGKNCVNAGALDYYWRDFYGTVYDIKDRILVGDEVSTPVHIGQGFCVGGGVYYGRIKGGLQTPCPGRASAYSPKILCSNQTQHFHWMATNSTNYKKNISGKEAVQGGFFISNSGIAHIGLYRSDNGFMIGSINSRDDNPVMIYVDPISYEFFNVTRFDVLIFKDY